MIRRRRSRILIGSRLMVPPKMGAGSVQNPEARIAFGRCHPERSEGAEATRMTSPSKHAKIIEADLTWTGRRFESGLQLVVGDNGRIEALASGRTPTDRHPRSALLPGFVNTHSHAFQRGLRGQGERFPAGSGDFWTWREAMYALVERLDERELFRLSVQAFEEMRDAGTTTVGEFHYLHHAGDGTDYEFDRVV